jgi:NAD(P)-dependent dehydrogenase (short-subunit alcohol dehydrogenase family)
MSTHLPVAIVTGGGQGLGKAIAHRLLLEGRAVALWESDAEAGQETEAELAAFGTVRYVSCDVSREADVRRAVARSAELGALRYVVNNAGLMNRKPIEKLSLKEWNQVIGVNLTSAFLTTKYCLPHLRKHAGAIVNLCSTRAFQSEPDTESYAATKGGILALTHALAISLGPDVRVNCISPGWIDVTPLRKKSARQPEALRPADHAQHPAGRVGQADDVARMVSFLLDDANSFITGQNITLDGGMTRKMIYEE